MAEFEQAWVVMCRDTGELEGDQLDVVEPKRVYWTEADALAEVERLRRDDPNEDHFYYYAVPKSLDSPDDRQGSFRNTGARECCRACDPEDVKRYVQRSMARIGQEMVNPITGERFVWRHTAASTDGEFAEFDLHLDKGAIVAGRHIHPNQREDFRVESGAIRLRRRKREETLVPGDERSVDAGVPHSWANVGSGDAHIVVRLTPALRSEEFFEAFCDFAQAGKLNKRGLPRNPALLAAWMHEYRREIAPPSAAQRVALMPLLAALAPVGRAGLKRPERA